MWYGARTIEHIPDNFDLEQAQIDLNHAIHYREIVGINLFAVGTCDYTPLRWRVLKTSGSGFGMGTGTYFATREQAEEYLMVLIHKYLLYYRKDLRDLRSSLWSSEKELRRLRAEEVGIDERFKPYYTQTLLDQVAAEEQSGERWIWRLEDDVPVKRLWDGDPRFVIFTPKDVVVQYSYYEGERYIQEEEQVTVDIVKDAVQQVKRRWADLDRLKVEGVYLIKDGVREAVAEDKWYPYKDLKRENRCP